MYLCTIPQPDTCIQWRRRDCEIGGGAWFKLNQVLQFLYINNTFTIGE